MLDETRLLQMWNSGMSQTEIGLEFNVTRSAVSGWIKRGRMRGVDFKRRSTVPPTAQRPPRLATPTQTQTSASVSTEPQGPRLPISLLEHSDAMCRAVFAYKNQSMYCSWPRLPGRSYCATCDFGKSSYAAPRYRTTYD
jgi:GcrA cell cycle regulator